jgi:ABC-2 type transport system ATP-binding protein
MDRGRLVAAGAVAELVGESEQSVYVEVDDDDAAKRLFDSLSGVGRVEREVTGFTVELDGMTNTQLVAELVHAGVGVKTVTSRRRLEDAFLGLVGEEHAR